MERIVSDFSKVKVGDKVYDLEIGEAEVVRADSDDTFLIHSSSNPALSKWRRKDGCPTYDFAAHALCFWSRPEFIVPPPPKRKAKRERVVWVNVYPNQIGWEETERDAKCWAQPGALAVAVRVVVPYEEEEK